MDLFPCPEDDCQHWNADGRKKCFTCGVSLEGVDPQKARDSFKSDGGGSRFGVMLVAVLAIVGLLWWFNRGSDGADQGTDDPPAAASTSTEGESSSATDAGSGSESGGTTTTAPAGGGDTAGATGTAAAGSSGGGASGGGTPATPPKPAGPKLPDGVKADGKTDSGHLQVRSETDDSRLIRLEGGTFTMGSDSGDPDEKPEHEVTVSSFYVDEQPITNAQYAAFCEATGHRKPKTSGFSSKGDHPVVDVTWKDAQAYAEWAGRRLLTEAEWSFAARGTDSRPYAWGSAAPSKIHGNFKGSADGHSGVAPVGTFPGGATPEGLLDMAGNVWEWTADRYSATYYGESPDENPTGPSRGSERTVRGGAHTSGPGDVRAPNRWKMAEGSSRGNIGFRTALDAPE